VHRVVVRLQRNLLHATPQSQHELHRTEGMTAAQMATAVGAVQSEQFSRCFRWAAAVNSCPRRQAGRPGGSHASAMNLHSLQWTQQTAYAAPVAGGAISSTKPSRL
jgi:hypothetical protein